mmetsp:Transcript_20310/g.48367  ORF Transcript_20310/g.48367 Transcript_20310/m.48367 type:complete len:338 (+) Transcript_20310:501-1514(+)
MARFCGIRGREYVFQRASPGIGMDREAQFCSSCWLAIALWKPCGVPTPSPGNAGAAAASSCPPAIALPSDGPNGEGSRRAAGAPDGSPLSSTACCGAEADAAAPRPWEGVGRRCGLGSGAGAFPAGSWADSAMLLGSCAALASGLASAALRTGSAGSRSAATPAAVAGSEMPAGASLLEEGVMARGGVAFPVGCGEAAGAAGAAGAAAAAALLACCSLPDCWAAWEEAGAEDWRKKGFSWTESSLDGVVGSPRAWFLRAAAAWRSRSLFRSASFSDSFSFSFSFSLSDFFSFSFFSGTSGGADTGSRIVALSSWSISTSYRSSGLPNSSKPSWLRST